MSTELAGKRDGIPERFSPGEMRGQLIEAEHLTRYRWASTIAAGKRVLDAGCGTAYGSAILAGGGAREVVGVDLAESVLESVRIDMPEEVRLEAGDLCDLAAYEDASFDLVVCFEVIEHFENPAPVLDHLARVLAPDGVLLISSPNRAEYPPGNPHHLHQEYLPAELAAELGQRLNNVQLLRQHSYVTSAVFSDQAFAGGGEEPLPNLPVYKLVSGELDKEMFTLACASDGPLPPMPTLAMLTSHLGLRQWIAVTEDQEQALHAHRLYIHELEAKAADREQLQQLLAEGEQRFTEVSALEAQIDELKEENQRLERSKRELHELRASPSWRITQPIRDWKRSLRRLLGSA